MEIPEEHEPLHRELNGNGDAIMVLSTAAPILIAKAPQED